MLKFKKRNSFRIISVITVLSLFLSIGANGIVDVIRADSKICPDLLEIMQESRSNEKIPVSIWLTDIDQDEVERKVEQQIGFTVDDVVVIQEDIPEDLALRIVSLSEDLSVSINEKFTEETHQKFDSYMNRTAKERIIENELTEEYISARRTISADIYVVANDNFTSSMDIPEEDVIFISRLSPMIIAELSARKIYRLVESSSVLIVEKYEEEQFKVDADCVNRLNESKLKLGLNGTGVHVGVIDQGIVDATHPDFQPAPGNPVRLFPHGPATFDNNHHAVYVARILAGNEYGVANGATVYSSCWGYGNTHRERIESLILEKNVSIINISGGGGGGPNPNVTVAYYNHIVNVAYIVLVNSGGNSREPGNRFHSSRASSDNTITVTATVNNQLFDYIHEQGEGNAFKPDIAAHGSDTSSAAPFVSGTVALMMQLRPSLKVQPQAVKAILMASAHTKAAVPTHCSLGGIIPPPMSGFTYDNFGNTFANANIQTSGVPGRYSLEFELGELLQKFGENGCTPIKSNEIYGINVVTWGQNSNNPSSPRNRQGYISVNGARSPLFHAASDYNEARIWSMMSSDGVTARTPGERIALGLPARTNQQWFVYMNEYNGTHAANDKVALRPFVTGVNDRIRVVISPNDTHESRVERIQFLSNIPSSTHPSGYAPLAEVNFRFEKNAEGNVTANRWNPLSSLREICVCRLAENMHQGLTNRQGAGVMDPYRAIAITAQGNYGVGRISTEGTFNDYTFQKERGLSAGLNVSLAWLKPTAMSSPSPIIIGLPRQEMRLILLNGSWVESSILPVSSTQMVYHTHNTWNSNPDFTIRVRKHAGMIPTRYAYAWSVDNEVVEPNVYGIHHIRSAVDGRYLDRNKSNGVSLSDFHGGTAQRWIVQKRNNDLFQIRCFNPIAGGDIGLLARNASDNTTSIGTATAGTSFSVLRNNDGTVTFRWGTNWAMSANGNDVVWTTLGNSPTEAQRWTIEPHPLNNMRGDINGDGKIDMEDVRLVESFLNNSAIPTALQFIMADVNFDGSITQEDRDIINWLRMRFEGV